MPENETVEPALTDTSIERMARERFKRISMIKIFRHFTKQPVHSGQLGSKGDGIILRALYIDILCGIKF